MQRNFFRGFMICLIPCLLAAVFAVRLDKYRLGIDLAGGTILVYEVNQERTQERKRALGQADGPPGSASTEGLTSEEMNQLAAQIKRRIDPTDIKNVTVRPLGSNRVEIILPISGAAGGGKSNLSDEEIQEVKRLISQMGVLEFRILANGTDDSEGIQAARTVLDSRTPGEMETLAAKGLAPPGPEGEFTVEIGESKAKVRYVWAELGPEERKSLGLSNDFEGKGGLWEIMRANRGKTVAVARDEVRGYYDTPDNRNALYLLYSRPTTSVDQLDKQNRERERLEKEGLSAEEMAKALDDKKYDYFILTRVSANPTGTGEDSLRVGGDITLTATAETDPKTFNPSVGFRFNGAGAQTFGKITRRNKPSGSATRYLAILLDDKVVSAPALQGEISAVGQITGQFDRKYVERMVYILKSGALSAELKEKPVSQNTIGPTLGADTIRRGTTAIGLAFLAVLAFMVFYYRFAGFVACVALFANLLLTVGFMVAVNAAFTLPGLAGLVLTLGIAVDANVLIYERLREERDKGANLITAIRNGYDRAFGTIIDTHMTSIFTAIVLYTFGNDNLKGFAISLTVGLIISLFTSLYMTRLMFDYWLHKKWLTELRMLRLFTRPNFRPMSYRWLLTTSTAILTLLGLGLFLYRGEAGLNVDFRGGTVFASRLKDGEERSLLTTDKPGFRDLLGEENQKKMLTPVSARWENRPSSDSAAALVNTYVYTITYADGSTATVTLSQRPGQPGDDEKAMEADVIARASQLPDHSVEQMFLSGETYAEGKSRYFTIRTTEKQPEMVRATLDRLLRDADGKTLMHGATMNVAIDGPTATLTFQELNSEGQPAPKPTSLNYVEELLTREFKKLGADTGVETFKLTGVGEPVSGRFSEMLLSVAKNPTFDKLAAPDTDPAKKDQIAGLKKIFEEVKQGFETAPEPERLEVFDTQLASETRTKAFYAIVASWIAILLYLWFRFGNWTFGLAAVLCLVHDLCLTLGAIAACHYLHLVPGFSLLGIQDFKIDLAAVAALLTLVGYSVSDTIVVFDRIREVRGKNPRLTAEMINDSVNQTLSRTILTATTVFLVSIVLYAFGGEGVHLFAFVMVFGVLIGTYSSIFVASPLLLIFGEGQTDEYGTPLAEAAAEREAKEEEEVLEG